jgi:hypothetical protein
MFIDNSMNPITCAPEERNVFGSGRDPIFSLRWSEENFLNVPRL